MVIQAIIRIIREWRLRRRFPKSMIYSGAMVDSYSTMEPYSVLFKNSILLESTLGRYSYVQANSVVCNAKISAFCSIAANVHIGLAKHPTHMVSTHPVLSDYGIGVLPKYFIKNSLPSEFVLPVTIISADVWIGQGAMIKAGVVVGVGSIIGAGAMVSKDVAPYSIVVGIPAHEIKKRFDELTCKRLIDSKWWEFDDETLGKYAPLFSDPEKFLKELERDLKGIDA